MRKERYDNRSKANKDLKDDLMMDPIKERFRSDDDKFDEDINERKNKKILVLKAKEKNATFINKYQSNLEKLKLAQGNFNKGDIPEKIIGIQRDENHDCLLCRIKWKP